MLADRQTDSKQIDTGTEILRSPIRGRVIISSLFAEGAIVCDCN